MSNFVRTFVVGLACGLVLVGAVAPVAAQTPRGEIAAGYQFLRDGDSNFPTGWFISGAGNLSDRFAIVGEVSSSRTSFPDQLFIEGASASINGYMGGVRYFSRMGSVTPFAQVLFGALQAKLETRVFGIPISESQTVGAMQPGAGVDVQLNDRFAIRFAGDYRRIFSEDGAGELRFIVGAVVGFGSR